MYDYLDEGSISVEGLSRLTEEIYSKAEVAGGVFMAIKRNKKATNPNYGKKMSIADMEHPIQKENEKALKLLYELDAIYRKSWWERWKRRNS